MRVLQQIPLALLFIALSVLPGYAGNRSTTCTITMVVHVSPASAVVNHAAARPRNQVQFVGIVEPSAPPGCPVPALVARAYATWSNPDPVAIQISIADNATNGTAVCKASTGGPVTLTGTFTQIVSKPVTKKVQLTCK